MKKETKYQIVPNHGIFTVIMKNGRYANMFIGCFKFFKAIIWCWRDNRRDKKNNKIKD